MNNQALADQEFAFQMLSNNTANGVPNEIMNKAIADIEKQFGGRPQGAPSQEDAAAMKAAMDELHKVYPDAEKQFQSELFRMWQFKSKVEDTKDVQEAIEILKKFNAFKESLAPHQTRVVEERAELEEKITKLRRFIYAKDHQELPEIEILTLGMQLKVMNFYSEILGTRIAAFMK